MKILMVTGSNSRGVTLAEKLSQIHDITVLHTGKIEIECPFKEIEINIDMLSSFQFNEYPNIIYLASEQLPCRYLTTLLLAIKDSSAIRCICIAENSLNLSRECKDNPERYICRGFKDQMLARLSFWNISALYGDDFLPDELMEMLLDRVRSNRIVLRGAEDHIFDALHVADLAKAIECYMQENSFKPEVFLSSGQQGTFKELGDALHAQILQANIEYSSSLLSVNTTMNEGTMDGWMPEHSLLSDLPSVVQNTEIEGSELLYADRRNRRSGFLRVLSFGALFMLVCLYTGFIRTSSELQYVDVRLLFVISTCLFWGKRYGLAAAILSSAASVSQSILSGTQWYVIFFHIDNWIPVAIYMASAVLFGMYQENHASASSV